MNVEIKNTKAAVKSVAFSSLANGDSFNFADGSHNEVSGTRIKLGKTKYLRVRGDGSYIPCSLKEQGKTSKSAVVKTGKASMTVVLS